MPNFQDTFETRKRSFISAFSICMTVPLRDDHYQQYSQSLSTYKVRMFKNQILGVCHNDVRSIGFCSTVVYKISCQKMALLAD